MKKDNQNLTDKWACLGKQMPSKYFKTAQEQNEAEVFFVRYAERSGTTVEILRDLGLEVFPCSCGADNCVGMKITTDENHNMFI